MSLQQINGYYRLKSMHPNWDKGANALPYLDKLCHDALSTEYVLSSSNLEWITEDRDAFVSENARVIFKTVGVDFTFNWNQTWNKNMATLCETLLSKLESEGQAFIDALDCDISVDECKKLLLKVKSWAEEYASFVDRNLAVPSQLRGIKGLRKALSSLYSGYKVSVTNKMFLENLHDKTFSFEKVRLVSSSKFPQGLDLFVLAEKSIVPSLYDICNTTDENGRSTKFVEVCEDLRLTHIGKSGFASLVPKGRAVKSIVLGGATRVPMLSMYMLNSFEVFRYMFRRLAMSDIPNKERVFDILASMTEENLDKIPSGLSVDAFLYYLSENTRDFHLIKRRKEWSSFIHGLADFYFVMQSSIHLDNYFRETEPSIPSGMEKKDLEGFAKEKERLLGLFTMCNVDERLFESMFILDRVIAVTKKAGLNPLIGGAGVFFEETPEEVGRQLTSYARELLSDESNIVDVYTIYALIKNVLTFKS